MIQIDDIGPIFESVASDASGSAIGQPAQIDGWHVNATHAVAGWEVYRVNPTYPRRVFGGAQTVFYTFASEREFLAMRKGADLSIPEIVPVPQSITMRQARLALLNVGLLASVAAAIGALPSPSKEAAQIEWDHSQTVERHRPFVQSLSAALGLTGAQLDALFTEAATL